jgi:hypothetical protein
MNRPLVNPGTLLWTGQHWVNFIREPGAEADSGMVSLWHTHYCAAGEGTMAYVYIPGNEGFQGICTDNPDIAEFIRSWMQGRGGLYDRPLPVVGATFRREGEVRQAPSWVIETEKDQIIATWSHIDPVVILNRSVPTDRAVWTLLFFTASARIVLNGHLIPGQPYLRDIWKPSIGGDRSSCVFALSETFIQTPSNTTAPTS